MACFGNQDKSCLSRAFTWHAASESLISDWGAGQARKLVVTAESLKQQEMAYHAAQLLAGFPDPNARAPQHQVEVLPACTYYSHAACTAAITFA